MRRCREARKGKSLSKDFGAALSSLLVALRVLDLYGGSIVCMFASCPAFVQIHGRRDMEDAAIYAMRPPVSDIR